MTQKAKKTRNKTASRKTSKRPAAKEAALVNKTAIKQAAEGAMFGVKATGEINKAMEKMMKQGSTKQFDQLAQEATSFGRDNAEAFIKSGTIFAKGFENLVRTSMTLAQSTAEKQAQLAKQAMTAKSLNEWADAQSKIAQANFDDFMASATKISELSTKLLTEASEPINAQMTKGMNKTAKAA